MNRKNTCVCLALYDWTGELDTVQFHELAKDFFDANGVVPNVCSVPRSDDSSQKTSYTIMKDRLSSEPLSGNALLLYHTLPKYKQLIFGWDVTASIDCFQGQLMDFCCDQTIRSLDLDYFEGLLDRIASIVKHSYGIGYLRSFELGPDIYAAGMGTASGYSKEEMAEADRIGAWFRERLKKKNRHLTGYLRNVYPLNVISEPHLSERVDDVPLADWISQAPHRGTLRSLPGDAWIWRIEESNVDAVRAELIPTGLLIAYPPLSK